MKLKTKSILIIIIVFFIPFLYGFSPNKTLENEIIKYKELQNFESSIITENIESTINQIQYNTIFQSSYFNFNSNKIHKILDKYKENIITQTYKHLVK